MLARTPTNPESDCRRVFRGCPGSLLAVVPGRATRLQGGVHLVVLAAYLVLSVLP